MLVYFCSRQWSKRSVWFACIFFVSTTTYQIFFIVSELQYSVNVDPIYCNYSSTCLFLFSTIIPTVWDLCQYIFVLDNNLPDKIYCYWITVKYFVLIKVIDLSGMPVYFCYWQLSKHSITCDCTLLMSLNNSVLSHTYTVLKYL